VDSSLHGYHHLLEIHTALVGVIAADEMQVAPAKKTFITGDAKAHAKAKKNGQDCEGPSLSAHPGSVIRLRCLYGQNNHTTNTTV
jgi:hypothetical protein